MEEAFNLREKMSFSLRWLGIGQVFNYLLQFIVWAMLARKVHPSDFGSLGVALALFNFTLVLSDLGMQTALIQRKTLTQAHKVTGFWACAGLGVIFSLFTVMLAPLLTDFFRVEGIIYLVIVFAAKLFLDSLGLVQEALFRRDVV